MRIFWTFLITELSSVNYRKLIVLSLLVAACSAVATYYWNLNKKKREKAGRVLPPFVHSPLSERSAAVAREGHHSCCCHEMKPYDSCDVTTKLVADDVSIRATESDSFTEEDEATGDVVIAMSPHKERTKEPTEKPAEPKQ
ncbi:unnamed protein product [Cylicocyclus nassatus]|uniref:Uncharacterized protein n=1 Tax=Cylicocyclus nassatus TaxID=53992 RepID=A0AA36H312_CYLNA|nr:unnamed protein product [Cylicocyclus nassatus]